eukprot:CAMPEP_0185260654 /NCGR_PEP_ID=MMETSP1359-20130426/9219_1 /TAXON_ID=552665 /ORGANISM="Bigelowiella longifila, Strain CCMP242" /LENGTH=268 /DNA_ID=CAMNT_0027847021 /DNA_START=487 /DNA_END=1293 /DNA_ORIENTATION=-
MSSVTKANRKGLHWPSVLRTASSMSPPSSSSKAILSAADALQSPYSSYLGALLVFGRLADHQGISNTKYRPDLPLPFSLWISLPLSRRLKNDYPQWKDLFDGDGDSDGYSITRMVFRERMRAMPFKYPRGDEFGPAALPTEVTEAFSADSGTTDRTAMSIATIKQDANRRAELNTFLSGLTLEDELLDRIFDEINRVGQMHHRNKNSQHQTKGDTTSPSSDDDSVMSRRAFEMCMLKWASEDPETEGDPVVEWTVFWKNLHEVLTTEE